MSGARFKGVTSIDDMLGYQSDSFKQLLKIDSNGVSAFTMEQIKAKAATLGLTDSLTAQAVALASDADFTAKAATGKLTFGKAFSDTSLDIEQFGKLVKNSGKLSEEQIKVLTNAASRGTDAYKGAIKNILSENVDLADSFIDLSTISTESTGKVKNTFKGLGATLKSFATSTAGITTIILGSMLAVGALVDQFDELSYTELQDKFEQSSSSYESAKSEVESVKSELESVNSQIDAINAEPLTFSSEAELASLQSQKAELEQILTLKENIAEASKNQLAYDALNASNATTSATDYLTAGMSDTTKGTVGAMDWLYGDSTLAKTLRMFMGSNTQSFAEQWNAFTDENLATLDTNKIIELQKQQQEIMDWFTSTEGQEATKGNTKVFQEKQKELEQITSGLTDLQSDIAERQSTISAQIEAMTDDTTGEALPGFEDRVASLRDTLNEISHLETIDMTDLEKSFNAIDKYFGQSSTSELKSYFQELANEGKLTADAIEDIGISASTIGTDSLEDVVRYFNDMATAATEASTAIDGSFEGVQAAFESENQGAEWDAMATNIESALELLKEGRVGTDDFQTVAAWLSPTKIDEDAFKYDAQAYVDAWDKAYNKVKDWFDSENPLDSMWAFANDLDDEGIADIIKTADGGLSEIIPKFETTAEAADELGVGVNAVEAAMHKLEEYGFEFDDVMFSGEGIDRYESALNNIKSLYESMDEGDTKDRLSGLIENWDSEFEKYQDDLSLLTEDQIVHIEFEYDLATIQQQIDQIKSLIEGGDASVENYAQVIAGNEQYIQTAEQGIGFNAEGVTIPVEYTANEDTIQALKDQLSKATSEEDKIAIQAEITNLQEIQKELLNAFSDAHPEINAESSVEEINNAWNDFVKSTEGQEIIANIKANDEDAKEKVAEILDMTPEDIKVDVEADDNATPVLEYINGYDLVNKLCKVMAEDDATGVLKLWNEVEATPKFTSLSAQDQASYVIGIWNALTPEQKEAYLNGEITVVDSATGTIQTVNGELNSLPLNPNANITATNNTSSAVASANASLNSIDGKTVNTYIVTHRSTVGDSKLSGTAHVRGTANSDDEFELKIPQLTGVAHTNGTAGLYPIPQLSGRALAMGTLQDDSWLKPEWQVKNGEVNALTGELGAEMVVDPRTNRWWTVGDNGAEFTSIPAGAVVFNAKQTKELLSKGKINTRGTAMLGGTAFATGGFLPNPGSKGWGYGTSGSSKPSSSGSSSSRNSSTSINASTAAKKEAEEFEESVDWIEMAIDRLERAIDTLDLKASSTYRSWSERNKNLTSEISKVTQEINLQQQGYNRYLQQANSVGLDVSWQEKVKNGEVNIETLTNEDLKNKIDEYQQW